MNDLNARKKEFYRAYDDAALRILLDRYAVREGEALRLELRALPPEENAAPTGEEEAVMRILSRCAGKKRAALRCSAALHTFGKVAVVLLVLGSLSGYAAFTASANQERQEKTAESVYAAQEDRAGEKAGEEAVSAEMEEERIDEEMETAD